MPSIPYTCNKEGKGPAWSNSLFENNAEFCLGIALSAKQQRLKMKGRAEELLSLCGEDAPLTEGINRWLETYNDVNESAVASKALLSLLTERDLKGRAGELKDEILQNAEHLNKQSVWMYGGDGWAYDIGFGGLDHVIAMGEDLNILVVDTEVYSNTGGQSSKATPLGAVAQFQASGKKSGKKDLAKMMMSYGNCYVASVAMGADMNQLMKAITEAEAHPGPSLIVAYAPCINHGIKAGMSETQAEMKRAVEAGYWPLFRYNPDKPDHKFTLDSKAPTMAYQDFLKGETRYASLHLTFPENARTLFAQAEEEAKERYEAYKNLAEQGL